MAQFSKAAIIAALGTINTPKEADVEVSDSGSNGNFRITLTQDARKDLDPKDQLMELAYTIKGLEEAGYNVGFQWGFKGSDGRFVAFPAVWVNKQKTAEKSYSESDVQKLVEMGVTAALKALKPAETVQETEVPATPPI